MRLPFFRSSDRRGEGGAVAFGGRSLFCGESSTSAARPPSLGPGPGASFTGRKTPTPWDWHRQEESVREVVVFSFRWIYQKHICMTYFQRLMHMKTSWRKRRVQSNTHILNTAWCCIWKCSYNWMCGGFFSSNRCRFHGWCGERGVGLRIQRWWAGAQRRTYSYTREALGCVFHRLTSCVAERGSETRRACRNHF